MTESQFKTKCVALLKRELPNSWIHHSSERFVSGIPDLYVLYKGVFSAIELKVKKNKATKLQLIILARIQKAGGMTWVCQGNIEDIKSICAIIKERANTLNSNVSVEIEREVK